MKLLLYHGRNDTAISPGNTVNYYSSVLSKMGPKQDSWVRLFMAPGMQHCGGARDRIKSSMSACWSAGGNPASHPNGSPPHMSPTTEWT